MNRKRCPYCHSYETNRVHTEWSTDMVEETRVCDECDVQFTNSYDLFEQETERISGVPG